MMVLRSASGRNGLVWLPTATVSYLLLIVAERATALSRPVSQARRGSRNGQREAVAAAIDRLFLAAAIVAVAAAVIVLAVTLKEIPLRPAPSVKQDAEERAGALQVASH